MISHVRIQNLRSLVDTGFVEIKPLTILLGSNSSGKSTFLRSFPLFKQSVSKPLREPISWFDDSLVDFGDFETARSRHAKEDDGIKFSFRVASPIYGIEKRYAFYYRYGRADFQDEMPSESTIELSIKKSKRGITYVDSVCITTGEFIVRFQVDDFDSDLNIYCDEICLQTNGTKWYYSGNNAIIPSIGNDDMFYSNDTLSEGLVDTMCGLLRSKCSSGYHGDSVRELAIGWKYDKSAYLKFLKTSTRMKVFKRNIANWTVESVEFLRLYKIGAALAVSRWLQYYDMEIKRYYMGCSYVAPMRAAANRYYRTQGLQVRDVDPYGKNLQDFILSLSKSKKASYDDFMMKVFGLKVVVQNRGGHQSIYLQKGDNKSNLTDVGFGYSQILPIVTKLWYATIKDKFREKGSQLSYNRDLILMEQPELHLHPGMQARTADIMMLALNEMKDRDELAKEKLKEELMMGFVSYDDMVWTPQLIVETHSQAMINRIGRRIRDKQFSADDVSILLFEKDDITGATSIRKIGFNEKGQLTNWPFGFFEPKEDDYDTLFNRQSQNK